MQGNACSLVGWPCLGRGSSSSQGAPASTPSSSVQRKDEGRVEEFGETDQLNKLIIKDEME